MYTLDFGIRTTSASQADQFIIQHLATFALQHPKLLTTDKLTSPPRSIGFVSSYLYTQGRHRMHTAARSKYVIPDDRDGSFLKRARKKKTKKY